jgi:dTDP-4-amino-4,6-dideoxygalactose transaminase
VIAEAPARATFLPVATPDIGPAEQAAVAAALAGGWLSTGPKVREFEAALAAYTGAEHVVAVASCTAALHLSLVALGVGPGDEVITSPITFAATANVVTHTGATPVFADVDPRTHNLCPEAFEAAITSRTRAVMPVHFAGLPCDMAAIGAIARRHGIHVIEDGAHAIGSARDGVMVGGDRSTIAAFSFYATKTMATGEGGAVALGDAALADRVRVLSQHGMSKDAWKRHSASGSWRYDVVATGYKSNFTDPAAALGLVQLARLEAFIATRARIAARYDAAFADLGWLALPPTDQHSRTARYIYPVELLPGAPVSRDEMIDRLKARNIGTSVYFQAVHLFPAYRERFGTREGMFPHAERFASRTLALPLSNGMTDSDVDDVIAAVGSLA